MILEKLILKNFRQFKDRQEIVFSEPGPRNITIIHAENGFGKTTLLKALLWVLYGHEGIREDFEKPEFLIHEGTANNALDLVSCETSVSLMFKHNQTHYTLTRTLTLAKQSEDHKKTELRLTVLDGGEHRRVDNPQAQIQQMVPQGLSGFLFFNGERINYLAEERNSVKVTEAIQQMLGLRLLHSVIDDLRSSSVRGKFRDEYKNTVPHDKRKKLDEVDLFQGKINDEQGQIDRNLLSIESWREEIDSINNLLLANQHSQRLQEERNDLETKIVDLNTNLRNDQLELKSIVANHGYTILSLNLVSRGREITSSLRAEGKIPARVLNTFLHDLINQETCICKRPLLAHTPERLAVEELIQVAGDIRFNLAVGELDQAIGMLEDASAKAYDILLKKSRSIQDQTTSKLDYQERIEQIHIEIGTKDTDDVASLERRKYDLTLKIGGLNSDNMSLTENIHKFEEHIKQLNKEMSDIGIQEGIALVAQRRVEAVDKCGNALEAILLQETNELRPLLNQEIAGLFEKITAKNYWAELSDDYVLKIKKHVMGNDASNTRVIDAALSTGERTVTSLVFIASLLSLSARRAKIDTIVSELDNAIYPIVIDSPFGSLSIFAEGVARHIPEFAPQVVLFVSPKQYLGEVEQTLASTKRIGRRYLLEYHGPSTSDVSKRRLTLGEKTYCQFVDDATDEFTIIRELPV